MLHLLSCGVQPTEITAMLRICIFSSRHDNYILRHGSCINLTERAEGRDSTMAHAGLPTDKTWALETVCEIFLIFLSRPAITASGKARRGTTASLNCLRLHEERNRIQCHVSKDSIILQLSFQVGKSFGLLTCLALCLQPPAKLPGLSFQIKSIFLI